MQSDPVLIRAYLCRGPYFLMQCFSTVFGSWPPLVFSHNLRHPSCSFFNTYDIITIMITTKCISRKIQQTTTKSSILQIFLTFNFRRQLNFTNIFNATVDFAAVRPASKLVLKCWSMLISHFILNFPSISCLRLVWIRGRTGFKPILPISSYRAPRQRGPRAPPTS